MDFSNHSELSTPFIAALIDSEPNTSTHNNVLSVVDTKGDTSCCKDAARSSSCDHLLDAVLYLLMFVQFGVFFLIRNEETASVTVGLNFSVISVVICLFMLATHLFRTVLTETGVSHDLAMILPELMAVLSMWLAMFQHVMAGVFLLVGSEFAMALVVVAVNSYRLYNFGTNGALEGQSREEDENCLV
jgi:hypothetical protein